MQEFDFIRWIRQRQQKPDDRIIAGPGDDCAIVRASDDRILVTTDQVLDGVHFRLKDDGAKLAGRKAMARNLSDVAAMAARPLAAVAAVALPKKLSRKLAQDMYEGMEELANQFNCPIVGGDISMWDGALTITITILATPASGIEPVLRSGAKPGDAVIVSGALGRSWKTDRHLTFTPRIAESIEICAKARPSAMIDISDGLAGDLGHICNESGVGADLLASQIPCSDGATLAQALGDGEDYELLFTMDARKADELLAQWRGVKLSRVGTITARKGIMMIDSDGHAAPLSVKGWEHGRADAGGELPEVVTTRSPADTRKLGRKIGSLLKKGDVVSLIGDLGAGKTVLVRGIAQGLGLDDDSLVSSPTYVLAQEYPGNIPIYHLDIYRLLDANVELEALGLDEMIQQGVVLVEWADRAPRLAGAKWEIRIELLSPRSRRFHIRRR